MIGEVGGENDWSWVGQEDRLSELDVVALQRTFEESLPRLMD